MGDISKEAVLYIHLRDTEYSCSDCTMLIPHKHLCAIHKRTEDIADIGSCGFFYQGEPAGKGSGYLTVIQSGYEESEDGFSCKRCAHFDAKNDDCELVDRDSEGDDTNSKGIGVIHFDACCNAWEPIE